MRTIVATVLSVLPFAAAAQIAIPPVEPDVTCFPARADLIQGYSRPEGSARLRPIFSTWLRCAPTLARDGQGNVFRWIEHRDRSFPGRAWVRDEDVHLDAARGLPPLEAYVASLRRYLAEGEPVIVEELAMAARKAYRSAELVAIELAAANELAALGHEESFHVGGLQAQLESLRQRGEGWSPPELAPERERPPPLGAVAFAAATRLRVRSSPADEAPLVAHLAISAKVDVLAIDGAFVKVRPRGAFAVADVWEVRGGQARPARKPPAPPAEGWVRWDYLADESLPARALVERAAEASEAGRHLDAFRDLERSVAMEAPAPEILGRLRSAAALSGRYADAVEAARVGERAVVGFGGSHARVALSPISRCRGDRLRAPVIDMAVAFAPFWQREELEPAAFAALPREACLLPFGSSPGFGERTSTRHCDCSPSARSVGPEGRRLLSEFRDGPWVKAEIWVPAHGFPAESRIFFFEVPLTASFDCPLPPKTLRALRLIGDVPWPAAGGSRTVWLKVDDLRALFGAVEAGGAEEGRRRAVEQLRSQCTAGKSGLYTFRFPRTHAWCCF